MQVAHMYARLERAATTGPQPSQPGDRSPGRPPLPGSQAHDRPSESTAGGSSDTDHIPERSCGSRTGGHARCPGRGGDRGSSGNVRPAHHGRLQGQPAASARGTGEAQGQHLVLQRPRPRHLLAPPGRQVLVPVDPSPHEAPGRLLSSRACIESGWRDLELRDGSRGWVVWSGTCREKHGDRLGVGPGRRPLKRRTAHAVIFVEIGIGAVGEECTHRFGMAPACCRAQGCAFRAASAFGVGQGPGCQQTEDVVGGSVD